MLPACENANGLQSSNPSNNAATLKMKSSFTVTPLCVLLTVLQIACDPANAGEPVRAEFNMAAKWNAAWFRAAAQALPFSFSYGRKSATVLLAEWPRKFTQRKLDDARTERTLVWNDPVTGLSVRCVAVEYADYPVVEWTAYFKNTGTSDTAILENIQGLDTSFERGEKGEFVLHGIKGDFCTTDSYEPYQHTLTPNWKKRFSPPDYSGKSCDGPDGWPYYNLQIPGGGVIIAVGWPG